ncbi:MAG: Lrp/AsnC family transcriptional regulator [Nitrososphaerales archaeon]
MSRALVLVTVDSGTDKEVVQELKKIPGVTELYEVYGAYDIIAIVEGASNAQIKDTVFNNIRRLNHVKSTLTMIIVED